MSVLDRLGLKHGTDKSSTVHGYLSFYETFLSRYRDKEFVLLEIGVYKGQSIRMWKDYFPLAKIIGVDIDEKCKSFASDRISIEIGDQGNPEFLMYLARTYQPAICCDDGCHIWSHQIKTLQYVYPALQPGGIYILEDIHTSFGDYRKTYSQGSTVSAYDYINGLIAGVVGGALVPSNGDLFWEYFRQVTEFVALHKNTCLIKKKESTVSAVGHMLTIERAVDHCSEHWKLNNGGTYGRKDAVVQSAPAPVYKRFREEVEQRLVQPPEAQVFAFERCKVLAHGVIVTEDGTIVKESMINAHRTQRFSGLYRISLAHNLVSAEGDLRPLERFDDGVCVLVKQLWDDNYGHWLIESLPRVRLIAEVVDLGQCKFLVGQYNEKMKQICVDSLKRFGVSEEQIVFARTPLYCRKLLYPAPLTEQPWKKAPYVVTVLEDVAKGMLADELRIGGSRKLYVSRNRTSRRILANEQELIDILIPLGYQVVHPEELSFGEQVITFAQADSVIGNLGAALSNIVFSKRGVRLFALTTEFMQDDFYYDLICLKDGTYFSLHGKALHPEKGMQSDFVIDKAQFMEMLQQFDDGSPRHLLKTG